MNGIVANTRLQADFSDLTPLLAPRSIAVIGASDDPTRIGGRPIFYMKKSGFQGTIWPVNPSRPMVQGMRAYASPADLPDVPDMAIIAVSATTAVASIEELSRLGVKTAVIFTSGFAEVGAEGESLQRRMAAAAKASGMRILGPNSLGIFNGATGYFATFTSSFDRGWPIPGRIGIVSQSGAYGLHLFSTARNRGIGTSTCIMTGNEADVTVGSALGWLAESPDIDVIAAYAEGIRDGETLLAALALAKRNKKPVVFLKGGRSELGQEVAKSHSAALAGSDRVIDAVFEEYGVFRARTSEEVIDVAHTATRRIYPVRNSVGVITASGGAGVLISDAAEQLNLEIPELPKDTQKRLKELVPYCAARNPVDVTGAFVNDVKLVGPFIEAVVRDGGNPSVLGYFSQVGSSSRYPAWREELRQVLAKYPDRLYVLSGVVPPERVAELEGDGWIFHEDPARAANAMAAMCRFGRSFDTPTASPPPAIPTVDLPSRTLNELEAKELLRSIGIAAAREAACNDADQAVEAAQAIGFPLVMKILSPDIAHKSEIGGVIVGVDSEAGVRSAFSTLLERARTRAPSARLEGVLVAKKIQGGVECMLGVHNDPTFGPVAMFGLGGIFVEVLKDVAFRLCPFGVEAAEQMIRSIKGAPLLLGARGQQPADIKALAQMLSRLSVFAHQAGDRLTSIDINPVFALPEGQGAFAADAVVNLAE